MTSLDELLTPDLDDLLTFRLYLAQLQDRGRLKTVTASDALHACDGLVARLSAQRWIAVRGAEADGADTQTLSEGFEQAKANAREMLQAKIAAHQP
jgi:hypothetical protein